MGSKIQLHFGDTVIPATLNDSTAAKELSTSYGQYANLGAVNCPLSQMEELYGNYAHPAFEGRGRLLFPWDEDERYPKSMTMVDASSLLQWHINMKAQEILPGQTGSALYSCFGRRGILLRRLSA